MTGAVTVDLAVTVSQNTGVYGFDRLINVENLISGNDNDALRGNALANRLSAGNGDDLIDGRAGDDEISGGDGADTLFGGEGDDMIFRRWRQCRRLYRWGRGRRHGEFICMPFSGVTTVAGGTGPVSPSTSASPPRRTLALQD